MGQLTDSVTKKINTPHKQDALRFGEPELPSDAATLNTETGDWDEPENEAEEGKRGLWSWIETALEEEYIFLYNEITCRTEFAPVNRKSAKIALNDRHLQSIVRVLQKKKGITKASGATVKNILLSDFVPSYNPVTDWFQQSRWDGTDHIATLAATIEAEEQDRWALYLRRWLIATVANACTPSGCQNHTCLVLVGAQGKGKTTWFNHLLPADLIDYYFVGKINVEDKDALSLVAEKLLVNIDDQLASINRRDEDAIKAIITLPEVSYRRPYDTYIQRYPRIASICASVNRPGFLTDDTGSRRFLPVNITNVRLDALPGVNRAQVWAQAYALWKSDERYWFSQEETDELNAYNELFRVDTPEWESIQTLFAAPNADNRDYLKFFTNAEICTIIKQRTGREPKDKEVAKALKRLGVKSKGVKRNGTTVYCYSLETLDAVAVEKSQKPAADDHKAPF